MRVRILLAGAIAVAAIGPCAGCRGGGSSLCGKWVLLPPKKIAAIEIPEEHRPQWFLVLKPDGTFTEHVENHVMMTLIADTTGTYERVADSLVLDGTDRMFMDDGYAKNTNTESIHRNLRIVGETLRERLGKGEELVFAREGADVARHETEPKAERSVREAGAVKLLEAVCRTYRALTSYADDGTLTGSGEGFMAKNTRFHTKFQRPYKFLFVEESLEHGRPFETNAVWSDGNKAWIYMGSVGAAEERPVGNGLGTISPSAGYECLLVPELLMPDQLGGGSPPDSYSKVAPGKDETLRGVICRRLDLETRGGFRLTLWVDPKSLLILQAKDLVSNSTIVYRPKAGAHLRAADFVFKKPQPR